MVTASSNHAPEGGGKETRAPTPRQNRHSKRDRPGRDGTRGV